MERLTYYNADKKMVLPRHGEDAFKILSKLCDYEDAEEQGRLMILPKRMTYSELVGEIGTINGALADVELAVYNLKKLTELIWDTLEQKEDEED